MLTPFSPQTQHLFFWKCNRPRNMYFTHSNIGKHSIWNANCFFSAFAKTLQLQNKQCSFCSKSKYVTLACHTFLRYIIDKSTGTMNAQNNRHHPPAQQTHGKQQYCAQEHGGSWRSTTHSCVLCLSHCICMGGGSVWLIMLKEGSEFCVQWKLAPKRTKRGVVNIQS